MLPPLAARWGDVTYSPTLLAVLLLAGAGTAIVFAAGAVAFYRRRTLPYLLLAVALGALLVRTVVGFGTVLGITPMFVHHLVGHGLDFLIAVLVLVAVYAGRARTGASDKH